MPLKNIHPVLIDFDGVIKLGEKIAPDANDFLSYLLNNKIPFHIISNSTLRTSQGIKKFLKENKIEFEVPSITAAEAALKYAENNYTRVSVYAVEEIKKHFTHLIDDKNPEAVIVGDLGADWSYETLNNIFRTVFYGADLVAMQMNKYWKPSGEFCLDAGAFISAIEYATGRKAILIGKPSAIYFQSALSNLGLPDNSKFVMIGDDLENDILASQSCGGTGVLVYTGKMQTKSLRGKVTGADHEAKNLLDVTGILEKLFNRK